MTMNHNPPNTISLGYSCKRIESCLWNAFEQRLLSQPCGQAILDHTISTTQGASPRITSTVHALPVIPTRTTTTMETSFTLNVLQSILLWLKAHEFVQKVLAVMLSVMVTFMALFPCHFFHRRRFHPSSSHSASSPWMMKRKIIQAVRDDPDLLQHVQRVLGESIHVSDLHHPHPFVPQGKGLTSTFLYRLAMCIIPKTTLMALILFLSWTSPLFMIVFLGFHVLVMFIFYLLGCLSESITSSSHHWNESGEEEERHSNRRPLLASIHGQGGHRGDIDAAFVGVPLKIV